MLHQVRISSFKTALDSLPHEILLIIFNHLPLTQLAKLNQVSFRMARALTCLPFLSTSQIIDHLYQADLKPLLKPFCTTHHEFAQQVVDSVQSEINSQDSHSLMDSCRRLLLKLAGGIDWPNCSIPRIQQVWSDRLKSFIQPEATSTYGDVIKNHTVVSFASAQVLDFFTSLCSTLERFIISFRGNNPQTAQTMFSRLYKDNVLTSQSETHFEVRSVLLKYPEFTIRLMCTLLEADLDSNHRKKLLKKVQISQNLQFVLLEAFFENQIPLKDPLVQLICWICLSGSTFTVKKMLSHPDVDPSIYNSLPLYLCLQNGNRDSVLSMLNDARVDPSSWRDEALLYAVRNGDVELVTFLLNDSRVSATSQMDEAVKLAVSLGHLAIFHMLLPILDLDSGINKNDLLLSAVMLNHTDIARVLLNDPIVNPGVSQNAALKHAIRNGNPEIVFLLLDHDKVDPCADGCALLLQVLHPIDNEDIFRVCIHHPKVQKLIASKRILRYRNLQVLALLAKNPDFVVHIDDLISAINECNETLFKFLLHNRDLDPSIDDNKAFILSAQTKSTQMMTILLNDPRVDPSAQNNAALRFLFHCAYETTDLEQMAKAEYPSEPNRYLRYTRSADFNSERASLNDYKLRGRLLIKHPKVQQQLAQKYPALSDPGAYAHLFS